LFLQRKPTLLADLAIVTLLSFICFLSIRLAASHAQKCSLSICTSSLFIAHPAFKA